jgi:hypothetical protein
MRCVKCGNIKEKHFYGAGFITLDQLNGESSTKRQNYKKGQNNE